MAVQALAESGVANRLHEPGSDTFLECMRTYWSNQEAELQAAAVFRPKTVSDLSTAIKVLHRHNVNNNFTAPFAIRSGGHQAHPGSANIQSGIVVDVRYLNSVELNEDRSLVTVGAGATFERLYDKLDQLGLNVPGARVAQVGIAGFTLGGERSEYSMGRPTILAGGVSYYSSQVGLTCDNVQRFEIVTADGSVLTASQAENQDLYRALKGGGNNFGVLTSVTFRTMLKEHLSGGSIFYDFSKYSLVAAEMHKLISAPTFDRNAAIFCAFGAVSGFGQMAFASLKYTNPVQETHVFQVFQDIPNNMSSLKFSSHAALVEEEGRLAPAGRRRLYRNCSIFSDMPMLESLPEIWQQSFQRVEHIAGVEWIIIMMPFLPSSIEAGKSSGGNSLGLANSTHGRPLVNICLYASWDTAVHDEIMEHAAKRTIDEVSSQAAALDVAYPYIYMKYAWKDQPAIDGYGPEAKAFLQAVSNKYDADGLFQKAVPGGFKLFT